VSNNLKELTEAVVDESGVLNLYFKTEDGSTTKIRLSDRAQQFLLQAVLSSSHDPLQPSSRHLQPAGLSRFRVADEVGLSFLFSPRLAIHFVLDRSLAGTLHELLATFDDKSTWRASHTQH